MDFTYQQIFVRHSQKHLRYFSYRFLSFFYLRSNKKDGITISHTARRLPFLYILFLVLPPVTWYGSENVWLFYVCPLGIPRRWRRGFLGRNTTRWFTVILKGIKVYNSTHLPTFRRSHLFKCKIWLIANERKLGLRLYSRSRKTAIQKNAPTRR